MFGVMLLGQCAINLDELQRRDPQPLALEPRQDLAHQPALNTIGLENNERFLHAKKPVSSLRRRPHAGLGVEILCLQSSLFQVRHGRTV